MSLTWKLALDATLSLVGLAFLFWIFCRSLHGSLSPAKILFKGMLTATLLGGVICLIHNTYVLLRTGSVEENSAPVLLLVGFVAVAGIVLSIIWTPHIAGFLASPVTNMFDGGSEPPERKPAYSAALSKRKANRPLEAIVAIREQLAKFPNDFKGVMLLAAIQAEDMNDLPGAEMTLNHFCNSPGVPDQQTVAALTRLADWYLNKAEDMDSVLAIMEQLMARFPDAEISRRTAQRLGRVKVATPYRTANARTKSAGGPRSLEVKNRR